MQLSDILSQLVRASSPAVCKAKQIKNAYGIFALKCIPVRVASMDVVQCICLV